MLTFKPKKLDPIEIQCLSEQMHAISCLATTFLESDDKFKNSDVIILFYRMLRGTSKLKDKCWKISEKLPSPIDAKKLLENSERIESMCRLSLSDVADNNLINIIKEIIDITMEFQLETKRLYY